MWLSGAASFPTACIINFIDEFCFLPGTRIYMLFYSLKQTLFRARHTQGKEGHEDDSPCDDSHSVNPSLVQMIVIL